MGYRIIYGEEPFEKSGEGKSRLRVLTAVWLLVFVLLVRLCWPQGTKVLQQTLVPRADSAYMQMQSDIQAGEPIADAVTAFCQRIVEEALAESG